MDSKLFHATWLQCLRKLKALYISGQKQILLHCIMEKLVIYQLTVLLIQKQNSFILFLQKQKNKIYKIFNLKEKYILL